MNKLVKGAFTLTIAGIIVKILSAVYRVPFQNLVGDTGFYIYQQVYPLYAMAAVLAFSGFPVVISKAYMERKAAGDPAGTQTVFLASLMMLTGFGGLIFLLFFFGAERLAGFMTDDRLALPVKIVSFIFLFFPIIAILRGYFQGEGDMKPTAYSQVGEQLVRVAAILTAAAFLMKTSGDLYLIGAGAMAGSVLGSMSCSVILLCFFCSGKRKNLFSWKNIRVNGRQITRTGKILFVQGLLVSVSNMLLIFLSLADSLNLYGLLSNTGIGAEEAKQLKGIYDRGQPLIQLGTVAAASMALPLVPFIAVEKVKNNQNGMARDIRLSLKASFFIGAGAAFGLMAIMEPANIMLFENNDGTKVLSVLSLLILFSSLITTSAAVLQGLGKIGFTGIAVSLVFF